MKKISILVLLLSSLDALSWDSKDFSAELLSPVTTKAKYVLYGGVALTATVLIFEDQIVDPVQAETTEDKPLGDFSKYGDLAGQMVPNALYVIGQSIGGATGDKKGYERALGMFKATMYASGVTTVLKYTVREPRPYDHKIRNSFPSGHSTTAFAFGGYILEEHGWKWGVPALGLSMLTGLSRINDNKHYLHDVLAGATIGLAYGIGIARQQKTKRETDFSFAPIFDAQTKGIAAIKAF
jgi:PAP2 superfamily